MFALASGWARRQIARAGLPVVQGSLAPATRVVGALQRGARVLIPPDAGSQARVIVRQPG